MKREVLILFCEWNGIEFLEFFKVVFKTSVLECGTKPSLDEIASANATAVNIERLINIFRSQLCLYYSLSSSFSLGTNKEDASYLCDEKMESILFSSPISSSLN
jgi:hypothetical protein